MKLVSLFGTARPRFAAIALLGASLALGACSGANGPPALPGFDSAAMQRDAFAPAGKAPMLYIATNGTGIKVFTESGKHVRTYAASTGASQMQMDDAGNAYVSYTKGTSTALSRYAIGARTPSGTYATNAKAVLGLPFVSHAGAVLFPQLTLYNGSVMLDAVWNPGVTGKPTRTFSYPGNNANAAVGADGTMILPYMDTAKKSFRYAVIPAGATAPSRTIVETLVKKYDIAGFSPNWLVLANDGTLYVGEWTFAGTDVNAGLYVYPPTGKEYVVKAGAKNPTGLALDAAGNVYVLNSNFSFSSSGGTCDTLHTLSVFSPHAKRLLRVVRSGFENGEALTVDASGNAFIDELAYPASSKACRDIQGKGAIARVASGAKTAATIVSNLSNSELVIYDGKTAINPGTQAP
jgi:hypothetical protein